MSNEFMEFGQYYGVKRQFTACYTPHQNGVVERKNRTIMNMARSMMKVKHLPNETLLLVQYIFMTEAP